MENYKASYTVDNDQRTHLYFSTSAVAKDLIYSSAYVEIKKQTGVDSNRITNLIVTAQQTF